MQYLSPLPCWYIIVGVATITKSPSIYCSNWVKIHYNALEKILSKIGTNNGIWYEFSVLLLFCLDDLWIHLKRVWIDILLFSSILQMHLNIWSLEYTVWPMDIGVRKWSLGLFLNVFLFPFLLPCLFIYLLINLKCNNINNTAFSENFRYIRNRTFKHYENFI